jgi:signal transduction histidine kinase
MLGDTRGALEDTNAYLKWVETDGSARKAAQMAMVRAKFDAAVDEQKLGRMRAETDAAKLTATRQRLVINIFVLATALIVSIGFSAWWLWRRWHEVVRVKQAAEERFATIGRLTAGIAHEFNNQLTVLQHGLAQLAGRPAIDADSGSQLLILDLQQSTRASAIVTAQLQSFGRQQSLHPQSIAIDEFFGRIEPILNKTAGEPIRIRFQVASPPPLVYADERSLTEALINLISNARDALPDGGTVVVQAEPGNDLLTTIRVIDEGTGMTPEALARASDPFFTTKPIGSGAGLGLSMVEGFVTQSGGSMKISSVLHHGTTVALNLPRGSVLQ